MPNSTELQSIGTGARPNFIVRAIAGLGISVRLKLLLAFLTITVLMIALALFGLLALRDTNARTIRLIQDQERIALYTELESGLAAYIAIAFAAIDLQEVGNLAPGPTWRRNPAASLIGGLGNIENLLGRSIRIFGARDPHEGARIRQFRTDFQKLIPIAQQMAELRSNRDAEGVRALVFNDFSPLASRLQRDAYTIKTEVERDMNRRARTTATAYGAAQRRVIVSAALAIGLALILGYLISATITWPMARIRGVQTAIASGDFTARAEVPNRDEFGGLAASVNTMGADLGALYEKIEAQKGELAHWNAELEARVAAQVEEIGRVNRLRRFLPPQVADMIVSAGDDGELLKSRRQTVTVLFADLRGFTAYANSVEPEQVIAALNAFHQMAGPLIDALDGTLERFLGDGLMVLFNAPLPCADPERRGVSLARQMLSDFAPAMGAFQRGTHKLGLGIGIATGPAALGQIGFEGRRDYSAIGTAPNLAARLCDQAEPGQILISEATAAEVSEPMREVGPFQLKGLPGPVSAFELT